MKLDTIRLKPGMTLREDVLAKSGKAIVEKQTVLTETEIEFIQAFLIDQVQISLEGKTFTQDELDSKNSFIQLFNEVAVQYQVLFSSWQANTPVKMYLVRELCLPLFNQVEKKSMKEIQNLLAGRKEDLFYYKTVALSLLAIKLAQQLNYDKSDWLQIGFAAILADIGLAKSKVKINSHKADPRHPVLSYEMIKDEVTLTKQAKIAILQHHERLDGSGFPLQLKADQIHPFAQMISISDRYFTLYSLGEQNIKEQMLEEKGQFSEKILRLL